MYPPEQGYGFSFDVGWKIREKLSQYKFISFTQHNAHWLSKKVGQHSYEIISKEYRYKHLTTSFHLFRGNFTGRVTSTNRDPNEVMNMAWLKARDQLGQYFYQRVIKDKQRSLFSLKIGVCKYKFNKFIALIDRYNICEKIKEYSNEFLTLKMMRHYLFTLLGFSAKIIKKHKYGEKIIDKIKEVLSS